MKNIRISWQIFVTSLLITVFALLSVTWYASSIGRDFFREQARENLRVRAELIDKLVHDDLLQQNEQELQNKLKNIQIGDSTRITLILPSGRVLADTEKDPALMDNHLQRPEIVQAINKPYGTSIRFSKTVKRDMMYVAIPIWQEKTLAGFVRTARDIAMVEQTIAGMQRRIFFAGIFMAVLTAVASLFMSRRITHPLFNIIQQVERYAGGDFSRRLPKPHTLEMARLSEALNTMADQIDEKIEMIERQKNEQQSVLESMTEGVIAFDNSGHVISMNKAGGKLLNVDPNEVNGKFLGELIKNEALENLVIAVLETSLPQESELAVNLPNEQILTVRVSPLQDEESETLGALMVLNDITRLRNLERGRREFVANVSHELRTPLTSIKGFVEALYEGALDEPENARRFMEIIYRQTNRLISILEDLLTLSRLEREGELDEVEFRKENLKSILENAEQICMYNAEKKNIRLRLKCPSNLVVRMNSPLIEEAMINLIDNAIKYSPENMNIDILAEKKDKHVVICVKDEGAGIPDEHLSRIFERFYRVDKARSRKLGGTGLGLAIVKHIAQVHGGHVDVQSEMGRGSCFSIYLPVDL